MSKGIAILIFCLDLRKFSRTENSHCIVKKCPPASNEETFLYLMTRTCFVRFLKCSYPLESIVWSDFAFIYSTRVKQR